MLYAGFDADRDYLINKFRNPVFEKGSGMDQEEIRNNILSVAEPLMKAGLPKPVVKAHCFDYVCNNMHIDVNVHDVFPGFGCFDRKKRPLAPLLGYWNGQIDSTVNKECAER